ncbi:TPA: ead/Ea22-like family protein [Klebsiella pneumoniae]|nr:ead/Ea22-like family protein [Klebsiella pneumoniae]HCA9555155.1 ead/Ea22-like family protein [Klebsiella pneumoniae]HCA9808017.1 ead/Ea22-like family protein [Klebsiella pneumoniae]
MTTDITELAQSLKAAAEKASDGDWVKESGDGWEAACSANDQANGGFIIAHFEGPDAAENREFVQAANPANILALVEALENSESRLHEVAVACATAEQALEKAQQQTTESENRVRKQNRHICELFDDNTALRQRIAGLESRTVTVKLPDINEYLAEVHDKTLNRAFRLLAEGVRAGDVAAMRAAGIKVEAE